MKVSLLFPLFLSSIPMICWGTMDFLSGRLSRKIDILTGIFLTQFIGIFFIIPLFPLAGDHILKNLWAPILLGGFNLFGWWLYMYGTKAGDISIVAPIAKTDFLFTTIFGVFVLNERINLNKIFAVIVVLIGLFLLSIDWNSIKKVGRAKLYKGVLPGILTAINVGITFFLLAVISRLNGWFYTSLIMRFGVALFALLFLLIRQKGKPTIVPKIPWLIILGVTIFDVIGFTVYNFTTSHFEVSYVVIITSAASLVSIALSHFFLKERLKPLQWIGIMFVIAGIIGLQNG